MRFRLTEHRARMIETTCMVVIAIAAVAALLPLSRLSLAVEEGGAPPTVTEEVNVLTLIIVICGAFMVVPLVAVRIASARRP